MTATLAIASTATAGQYNLTVTTSAGASNAAPFTVTTASAPTLTAAPSPNQGNLGQSVKATLVGTNFVAGATSINFATGSGVTATNISVASATTLTATFVIAPTANLGWRQFTVHTPGGTSAARWFVVYGVPSISGMTPVSGTPGTVVAVTLSGTNFSSDALVHLSGTGISLSNQSISNGGKTLKITFALAAGAPAGVRSVTVSNSAGTSNAVSFTVQ